MLFLLFFFGCAVSVNEPSASDVRAESDVVVAGEKADSETAPTLLGTLRDGETLTGSFSETSQYLAAVFTASRAAPVGLGVGTQGDPTLLTALLVYASTPEGVPTGTALLVDEGSESAGNFLRFSAPGDGDYVALVRRQDLGTSGGISISMTVEPPPPPNCVTDPTLCSETQYCRLPAEASCGETDVQGTCETKPRICAFIYRPVCGCNGRTYGNACAASSAGVHVAHAGRCPATPDCRTLGCEEGRSCSPCWGGLYVCLPDGVIC